MAKLELIATAAFGLESVVAREIKNLGYQVDAVENGKITFVANELGICRANLWLRSAERVLVKMDEFPVTTFEELFQQTKALPWEEWLPSDAEFPVEGKSVKSKLFSVPDCQAIVKKAIVERMKETYGLSWFKETGPRYKIEVAILKDIATLTIDTSGPGLHKRGYRKLVGEAPLKETLAAGMIQLSYWKADRVLLDPFCGTGTIPLEAALIAQNQAPGLNRPFISEKWPNISDRHWQEARQEARDVANPNAELRIYGSDIDPKALQLARTHATEAGLQDKVFFQRLPVAEIRSRYQYGHIITNPPYGERLGEQKDVVQLYQDLGEAFKHLETWSLYFLTTLDQPERFIGRRWDKSRKLYNGRIECHYYSFYGPKPPKRERPQLTPQE